MRKIDLDDKCKLSKNFYNKIFTEEVITNVLKEQYQEAFTASKDISLWHVVYNPAAVPEKTLTKIVTDPKTLCRGEILQGVIVGACFYANKNVMVPALPQGCTTITGYKEEDIKWKKVKAGTYFVLTYLECLLLLKQEQYCLTVQYRDTESVAVLVLKWGTFNSTKMKLPTVFFRVHNIRLTDSMLPLFDKITNDSVSYHNRYGIAKDAEDKFAYLLKKHRGCPKSAENTLSSNFTVNNVTIKNVRNVLLMRKLLDTYNERNVN